MSEKSILHTLFLRILSMRTMTLVNIFVGLAFLLLIISFLFKGYVELSGILLALAFFFWGLSGLPIIIRREVYYWIISFEGLLAVIIGIIMSLAGFLVSSLLLFGICKSFISR